MIRNVMIFVIALVFLVSFSGFAQDYEYIGAKKCFTCHKGDKKGNQQEIWEKSGHAKAFTELTSESGMKKAKELGVENPTKSDKCMSCHSTVFGKKAQTSEKYTMEEMIAEGVTCESCHGPGSEYKSMKVMKDRELAISKGMIAGDKKTCLTCHIENNPAHSGKFNYEKDWAKIAHPIPAEVEKK